MRSVVLANILFCASYCHGGELYLGISSNKGGRIVRVAEDGSLKDEIVSGLGIISDMDFDSAGNLYLVNTFSLQQFDRKGQLNRRSTFTEEGRSLALTVAVGKQDEVYVGMSQNDGRILVLDPQGKIVDTITSAPGTRPNIDIDQSGRLLINAGPSLGLLSRVGNAFVPYSSESRMSVPDGSIAIDASGQIFVASLDSVGIMTNDGRFLTPLTPRTTLTTVFSSMDVEADRDNGVVYGLVNENPWSQPYYDRQHVVEFDADGHILRDQVFELDGQVTAIAFRPESITRVDVNDDGLLLATDLNAIGAMLASPAPYEMRFDVNRDGDVNKTDLRDWLTSYGTIFGDANLDERVDLIDFLILGQSFGERGGWESGDFNVNGNVDFGDFLLLAANYRFENGNLATSSTTSIPEPSAGFMFSVCASSVLMVCSQRSQTSCPRPKEGHSHHDDVLDRNG